MEIELKDTKIDFTGKSDAEKIAFINYVKSQGFNLGYKLSTYKKANFYTVCNHIGLYPTEITGFKESENKDITEDWFAQFDEPKEYNSPKKGVSRAILDFALGEDVQGWSSERWENVNLTNFNPRNHHMYEGDNIHYFSKIRKLQKPAKTDPRNEGLKQKYIVHKNNDEKTLVTDHCIVLKFKDNIARPAIKLWARKMQIAGFANVYKDVMAICKTLDLEYGDTLSSHEKPVEPVEPVNTFWEDNKEKWIIEDNKAHSIREVEFSGDNCPNFIRELEAGSIPLFDTEQEAINSINPYAELEKDGKFKVVEAFLNNDGCYEIKIGSNSGVLSDWISHKDFAGYVFKSEVGTLHYSDGSADGIGYCWSPIYGHACAIRFKVENNND